MAPKAGARLRGRLWRCSGAPTPVGTISSSFSNPLAGKRAWCGNTTIGPFSQVQVSLAAFDGQTVTLRWHEGDDSSVARIGWFVDSIVVTNVTTPVSYLARGKAYELFRWDAGWKKEGEGVAGEGPLVFEGLPEDGLYWLVEKGSKKLERIFTIEEGKQLWW